VYAKHNKIEMNPKEVLKLAVISNERFDITPQVPGNTFYPICISFVIDVDNNLMILIKHQYTRANIAHHTFPD
jgi:hypothetical protein